MVVKITLNKQQIKNTKKKLFNKQKKIVSITNKIFKSMFFLCKYYSYLNYRGFEYSKASMIILRHYNYKMHRYRSKRKFLSFNRFVTVKIYDNRMIFKLIIPNNFNILNTIHSGTRNISKAQKIFFYRHGLKKAQKITYTTKLEDIINALLFSFNLPKVFNEFNMLLDNIYIKDNKITYKYYQVKHSKYLNIQLKEKTIKG